MGWHERAAFSPREAGGSHFGCRGPNHAAAWPHGYENRETFAARRTSRIRNGDWISQNSTRRHGAMATGSFGEFQEPHHTSGVRADRYR